MLISLLFLRRQTANIKLINSFKACFKCCHSTSVSYINLHFPPETVFHKVQIIK